MSKTSQKTFLSQTIHSGRRETQLLVFFANALSTAQPRVQVTKEVEIKFVYSSKQSYSEMETNPLNRKHGACDSSHRERLGNGLSGSHQNKLSIAPATDFIPESHHPATWQGRLPQEHKCSLVNLDSKSKETVWSGGYFPQAMRESAGPPSVNQSKAKCYLDVSCS